MSLWGDFTGILKNTFGGILGINPGSIATQAGASMAGAAIKDPRAAAQAGILAETATKNKLAEAGIATQDNAAVKAVDPILYLSDKAEHYVFSPLIARPISTLNLLTDSKSPLYNDGFQLADITKAYDRSKYVSLGQSLLKSDVGPLSGLGFLESKILEANNIDVNSINLYKQKDIEKNFVDNTLGRWITGVNDTIIKNVAINAAFSGAGAAAKAGLVRAGLTTKLSATDINAIPKLEKDMYDDIQFRETGKGTQTVIGQDVHDLANSDNIIDITRIVNKHSFNPNLPDLIKNTKDPRIVADLLLADKGWGPAIERLANAGRADDLWVAGDGTATFVSEYVNSGKLPEYTAEQRQRWMKAFDDAIAKDPKHKEIYDAFLSQEFDPVTGDLNVEVNALGKQYRPIEPIGMKSQYSSIRSSAGKLKTAIKERDFTNPELSGVAQTVLGGSLKAPITVLLRNFGTYMPRGIVTNSGLRPLDGVQELVSVFDDIPSFRDGTKIIKTHDLTEMSVSDYRRNLISEFTSAKTDGERALVIKNANKNLAKTIAYNHGYFNDAMIENMVDDLMQDVYSVHGNLSAHGHAMDPTGVRLSVDIRTQRQLQNSMPMLPFGDLDRKILSLARSERGAVRGAATKGRQFTANSAKSVFEASNRIFSVAQLYRFSYVPKNSIFEPILAGTIAEGTKFTGPLFTQASKAAIKETSNFIIRNVAKAKTLLPSAKTEIQREIKALSEQYNLAIINRDNAYAAHESMFSNQVGVSPATRRDWADKIRAVLKDAEKDVRDIEAKLNTYTIEYGKPYDVPSVYSLKSRIETLKAAGDVRYSSEIRAAELTLQKAVGDINTLAPELNVVNDQIAAAYKNIGDILEKIGPKAKEQASLFKVTEGRYEKKPLLPETQSIQLSNGQVIEFDSFASRKGLGEGWMSEIANSHTRTLEMLGNKSSVIKVNTILSRSPRNITQVADPNYFTELAYVVNNHMRGDILVDRILMGQTRKELIDTWSKTGQARKYAEQMGRDPNDIVRMIDEQIGYVNRYLPTLEAKTAAAEYAVTPEQLRGMLGDKLDQMVPIQPLEIEYAKPTTLSKSIANSFDSALASSWRTLMKPENMIREVWGTARHKAIVGERADMLVSQGHTIDVSTINKLSHAAAVQLVDEVSKVFYTIPRQSRAIYFSRALATYPAAAASGLMRYSRFAFSKNPRFMGFLNSYYGYYNSFGVDQYGNPVNDPMKAQYLMIPGTKEMGLNNGKGVIISARATNYVMNFPGASWAVPILLSKVYSGKPNSEDEIKKAINNTFGKIPGYSYEELFPYGIEQSTKTQIGNTFTPAWARNLALYFSHDTTNKNFVDSWLSEANNQWILYEMNAGPAPTEESIMNGARNIYLRKFRTQMFSILGTPQIVANRPDAIYQDYFFMAYNNELAKGTNTTEAWKIAEKKFQTHMVDLTGKQFPMDRLFAAQSSKPITYITPSVKSYNRIWEDYPELATKLRQVDPSVVGLMVADLPKEYSPQINKFLNSTSARLPDGTPVNSNLSTPQLMEEEIDKSRYWSAYSAYKNQLNDAAIKAGYTSYRSVPELRDALKKYAEETLAKGSRVWYLEYSKNATQGNQAQIQAQGLFTVVNDPKFMDKFGKTQFWQHAKAFVTYRNQYAAAYAAAPNGSKAPIKEAWLKYLADTEKLWDPTLQRIITRYFENDNLKGSK